MSHPFWDAYLEFEDRQEQPEKIFAILDRVIHMPMHQYARYFEKYRQMAATRPVRELLPPDVLAQFQSEVEQESKSSNAIELERELRTRIDNFHLEIFHRTQTETTKRWTYEQEIKRPYFHVTELDEPQLVNWRKYLEFEEIEGNYLRIVFLYERCLVACAHYDEFWFRYARWMYAQEDKEQEVRLIYQRASCLFVPICRPQIRHNWAVFEESVGHLDVARDIHMAILLEMEGHILTVQSLAHLERRHGKIDDAIAIYREQIENPRINQNIKGGFVGDWALLLSSEGLIAEAREVFEKNKNWYMGSRAFLQKYYQFTRAHAASLESLKRLIEEIRTKGQVPPSTIRDIAHDYMAYLLERGTAEHVKEYLELDKEINGYVLRLDLV
jgi:pre-mRNA-processing factor 39